MPTPCPSSWPPLYVACGLLPLTATQLLVVFIVPQHRVGLGPLKGECRECKSHRTVPETSAECPLAIGTLYPPQGGCSQVACPQAQVVGCGLCRSEQVAWARLPTQDGQQRLGSTAEVPVACCAAVGGMTQSRGYRCRTGGPA